LTKPTLKLIKKTGKLDRNKTQTGGSTMSLMSFDILEEIARMRREIDRIVGEGELSSWTFPFSRISFLPGRASQVYPLINISEDNNNFYVDALAPGLDPETLNVSVTGDQLSDEVDQDKISAESKNGVLTITMPKAEKTKPKQIKVKVG
jgi:HSP20 family protein